MDFLHVISPGGKDSRFDLDAAAVTTGRSSNNDLILLDDQSVSRVHARILRKTEGIYLIDEKSKHGTYVNGARISEPTKLRTGDRVVIGRTTLIFNGAPTGSVEFSDRPLTAGPGTTILSPRQHRTPVTAGVVTTAHGPSTDEISSPVAIDILTEANEVLVFHRPLPEILDRIMDLAHRVAPYERGLLMLSGSGRLVPQVVRVPENEVDTRISISTSITDRVMKDQNSVLTYDAPIEGGNWGDSVAAQNLRSVICVPLWNNRDVIGLLYFDHRHRAGVFTETDLRVLTQLANVAAVKIENARLFEQVVAAETMKQELERAAEIQNLFLPQDVPSIEGCALDGTSVPCREVGGDYFDFAMLEGGRHAVAIGDVAGKGLPAALLMCAFQASFRALLELDLPPGETLARLNRLLVNKVPANRYVTFFYGVVDPAKHLLTYANAGHNAPIVLRADGSVEHLPSSGLPIGMFETDIYRTEEVQLGRNDLVVCFSDGVTEARAPDDTEFGEEALLTTVREARDEGPSEIVRRVTDAIDAHHAGRHASDDLTLVIFKQSA